MGEPPADDSARMTFAEHLDELRRRLGRGLLVLVVLFLVGWFAFADQLEALFIQPHERARDALAAYDPPVEVGPLVVHGPLEPVFYTIKVSLVAALLVGFPYLLYQVWAFIGAGLYPNEKRTVLSFLPWSILAAFAGIAFGYLFFYPTILEYLYSGLGTQFEPGYRLQYYFSLFLLFTAALALIFQLPLLLMGLGAVGLVDAAFLRKYRRHFILGAFILGAMLTPPEPFSQVLMAAPTVLLFELGVLLVAMKGRPKRSAPAADDAGAGDTEVGGKVREERGDGEGGEA